MDEFLKSTDVIDWKHPNVQARARSLAAGCDDLTEIARRCFDWVRDEIKHSGDHGLQPVTCSASDVLEVGSGLCYAKSHLLAALLRANGIPSALCYQRLRCDDEGTVFALHGLNAVHLSRHGWYRIDARGNRTDIDAQFTPPVERLAFGIGAPGEADLPGLYAEPLPAIVAALRSHSTLDELCKNLPDVELATVNARLAFEARPATVDDAETLAQLAGAVFRDAYRSAFDSDQQVEDFIATNFAPPVLRAELKAGSAWYSIGLVNDVAAGFIKMEHASPPECVGDVRAMELAKLYVLRPFHGCGIADVLMERGLEHARHGGASRLWLCVWERNARAARFYRRWGFAPVGEMSFLWSGVSFRDLVMTRRASPDPPQEAYSVGYDQAAAEFFGRRRASTHASHLLPHLRPGMRLLDGGCGPGTITTDLAEVVAPAEVVGIDVEPSQIDLARKKAVERGMLNVRFEVADLYSLPFPDESFDAIFLHGVLEHLGDPVRGLREAWRVLKRGGVLGARHADFGGFLLEPAPPPLDQFANLFERLMLHSGADPRAGRHQLQWLTEAGFGRIEMSASYDCWTSTPEMKRASVQFLESLFGDSAFARQLLSAGLADRDLLERMRRAFTEWGSNRVSFAAEAWAESIGWKPSGAI